jgi:hypothetical protein
MKYYEKGNSQGVMSGPSPTCGPISVETNPGQQALISKLGFSRAKMAVMELMHTLTWNIRSRTIHPNLDILFGRFIVTGLLPLSMFDSVTRYITALYYDTFRLGVNVNCGCG